MTHCITTRISATALLLFGVLHSAASWGSIETEGMPRAVGSIVTAYLDEAGIECPITEQAVAAEAVRNALDALGYFAATFTVADCTVTAAIGERARIAAWDLTFVDDQAGPIAEDPPLRAARKQLPALSDAFDPQRYGALKERFLAFLSDAGYVEAAFAESSVDIDIRTNEARVVWRVAAGERLTINPIIIEQDVLSRRLMRRFLTFEEGDYLTDEALLETYDDLASSDYFARVRVTPQLEARRGSEVPVKITATAAQKWSYLAGPGFATDTGPRVRAEANARYLNKSGNRLGFTSMLAPVSGNLKAEYRWPYGNPSHEWYSVEARFNYEDTDTAQNETAALGLRRTSRIGSRWTQTLYSNYSDERFDISAQEGRSQLLMLGSNFTYTSTIDAPRPRWGQRLSIDLRAADEALASDNSVVQLRVSAKQILPFVGRTRLLLRGEAGFSWQESFADLPASLRFFAGGDKSVRGFAFESLGTTDATGRVIGGDRLYAGSVELDMPFRKNWSLALFTDAGTAFLDKPDFSQSVGLGVRWYSPLGPVRVDLAHPLQDSDQLARLHISLGPDI